MGVARARARVLSVLHIHFSFSLGCIAYFGVGVFGFICLGLSVCLSIYYSMEQQFLPR